MVVAVARGPAAPAVADGAAAAGSSSSPKEPPGSRPSDFKATQQQEKALDLLFCFYESLLWRRCRRGRYGNGQRTLRDVCGASQTVARAVPVLTVEWYAAVLCECRWRSGPRWSG